MTMSFTLTSIAVAALAILTTTDAKAVPVRTFYNTGVDNTQTTLRGGFQNSRASLGATRNMHAA